MTDGATSMSMSYTNYKTIERLGEGMTMKVLALVPCSIKKSPAFDTKQTPSGRSPEYHQVCAHAYLSPNKVQSCFIHSLSILVCSMFECVSGNKFIGLLN